MKKPSFARADRPVVLFGATGVTGKLIVEEFKRAELKLRLVGRNEIELKRLANETGFDFKTVQIDRSESIKTAMAGASVVINCIGPFKLYGDLVVSAACELGIHYIDTTGEQSFIRQTLERYAKIAKEKGIAIAPACAFEYAISDTLAELALVDHGKDFDLEVYYLMKGFATSVGTRRSVFSQLSQPWMRYQNGALTTMEKVHFFEKVTLPNGNSLRATEFASGEALLFPLHLSAKSVRSFLAASETGLPSFTLSPGFLKAVANTPLLGDILKAALTAEGAPRKEALQANSAKVILVARNKGNASTYVAEATDPYALTAVIATALAERLSTEGAVKPGFCAPSMVAGPEFIRESTRERGVTWMV